MPSTRRLSLRSLRSTRPRRASLGLCASVVAAVAELGGPARAAEPTTSTGFEVDSWRMGALPTFDLLDLATSRVPTHLVPAFGFQLGYVHHPLELVQDGAPREVTERPLESRVRADFAFGIGLFDRFAAALVVPLVLSQSGAELGLLGRPGESASGFALGDLRLDLRAHLARWEGFGLAVAAELSLPTGDGDRFASAGGAALTPRVVLDWFAGSGLGVVVNLGWRFAPETSVYNVVVDDGFVWGVGLDLPTPLAPLHVTTSLHGLAAAADGQDPFDPSLTRDDDRSSPVELDLAFELRVAPVVVTLGGGAGLTRGVGAPEWRAFVGVGASPHEDPIGDRDGDGFDDLVDRCPDAPEDRDGFEDKDGCPDLDDDQDGIPDLVDGPRDVRGFGQCKDSPEDKDGFEDEDGCPDLDNDRDGVLDLADGAPDASGFGACRGEPEDKDGFADDDGCPDPDNDQDGVPDADDGPREASGLGACRDAPETRNGYRDEDGCPDEAPKSVRVTQSKIEILEKVFFDFNKATIKAQSFSLLDEVARVMREAPELTRIQVEGHTDSQGRPDYNLKLSQARADAVRTYLIERGAIASERLVAMGFGQTRPIVTGPAGKREPGMGLNRRVEFVILEVKGRPHSGTTPVILDRP